MVTVASGYSRIGSNTFLSTQKLRKFLLLLSFISVLVLLAALAVMLTHFFFYPHRHTKCHNLAPPPPAPDLVHGAIAISAACNFTNYPDLCFTSLSSSPLALSAKPPQLVAFSLSLALADANSSYDLAVLLSKEHGNGSEIAAVTDCVELMDDARDQLNLSISRLSNLDLLAPSSQIKDVQTWVSAALTFDTTCSDGFEDVNGEIADQMLKKADELGKQITIGLALVAHLGDHIYSWSNSTVPEPPTPAPECH